MRRWSQILGAISASLGLLLTGNCIGFITIALPQLQNETDKEVKFCENLGSWFASVFWITGLFISPFGGILSGKFGRRKVMLCFVPFVLIGWILMSLAYNKIMIFLALMMISSFNWLYLSSIGVYISETVHPNLRSSLVILPVCFMASGKHY